MKTDIIKYKDDCRKHLAVVKDFFQKYSLAEAIKKAAKAEDPTNNGKMFGNYIRV